MPWNGKRKHPRFVLSGVCLTGDFFVQTRSNASFPVVLGGKSKLMWRHPSSSSVVFGPKLSLDKRLKAWGRGCCNVWFETCIRNSKLVQANIWEMWKKLKPRLMKNKNKNTIKRWHFTSILSGFSGFRRFPRTVCIRCLQWSVTWGCRQIQKGAKNNQTWHQIKWKLQSV